MPKRASGFRDQLVFDTSKPDGTLSKLLDVSMLTVRRLPRSISYRAIGWADKLIHHGAPAVVN